MFWWWLVGIIVGTMLYCEFVGDYITLQKCTWPKNSEMDGSENLRVILLADTHLLGPLHGHILDKLYREWHMRRAFQAAMQLHRPDVVFVLGDLFDEGDFVDDQEFQAYVQRFHRHFHTPNGTPLISAVGNHDVGFHYKMHPFLVQRFQNEFNNTGAKLYTFKDVHFVLINSMSLQNDGCHFCSKTLHDLHTIAEKLKCLEHATTCTDAMTLAQHKSYSRPIVLQHFPTYRISDKSCVITDAPVIEKYRSSWEVLSKESTDLLGELLKPRLAFAGHSHHYCLSTNRWGQREYTIASFSWRNKVNPSFLMASISKRSSKVTKCDMLAQAHVCSVYTLLIIFLVFAVISRLFRTKLHKVYRKIVVNVMYKL